jgi:lysophospholipase L1-like esterase
MGLTERNVVLRAVPFGLLCLLLLMPSRAGAADAFELVDGDRVVWLGGTVIEQEQRYGYWETALTAHYPDRNITFRNLGWSGDTVWGESRAGFDTPREGYKRLVEHTLTLKPTVLLVGYGTNEAFAGKDGLPAFKKQYNKLLDDLAPGKARVVLLVPPRWNPKREPLLAKFPQPTHLADYREAVRQIGQQRGCRVADLSTRLDNPADLLPEQLTDDGMHLTGFGYWRTATALREELGIPDPEYSIELSAPNRAIQRALPTLQLPPAPPSPTRSPVVIYSSEITVRAKGLTRGKSYLLQIDQKSPGWGHTQDASSWTGGWPLLTAPDVDQAEKLRQLIVEKNRLYFYRWRPANETYLFGFRKHEQGQNAREIPQFDPLIAKLEAEIAKMRVPVAHRYELVPKEP